jgi:hypothetical protein
MKVYSDKHKTIFNKSMLMSKLALQFIERFS